MSFFYSITGKKENMVDFGKELLEAPKRLGGIFLKIFQGLEPKIPGKKPCDSDEKDDGTSCWKHTYGNGVGTIPTLNSCPPGSKDVLGTCWLDSNCNTTGGNCWGGPIMVWDGCFTRAPGWLGGGCIGGFKNIGGPIECAPIVTTGCPYVTKNIGDRGTYCKDGKVDVAGFCYTPCKKGYEFVGGNLCQPIGGPGIKKTAFQRYECPPPGHPEYKRLKGALCYK